MKNKVVYSTIVSRALLLVFIVALVGFVYTFTILLNIESSVHQQEPLKDFLILNTPEVPDVPNAIDPQFIRPSLILEPDLENYPTYTNLLSIITSWNPDNPDPPPVFKDVLQRFNYSNPEERAAALKYRDAELPFTLYDVPEFNDMVQKWTDDYLTAEFEKARSATRVDKSESNHFMKWDDKIRVSKSYKPPTEILKKVSFKDWLRLAKYADNVRLSDDRAHYYFLAHDGVGGKGETFISRDLSLFSTQTPNFFVPNVNENKAIACRLSTRGIISEDHYDNGKNMVVMMKGAKRYILSPPSTCKQLGIVKDPKHPSWGYSQIDWSNETQAAANGFSSVPALETIVTAGEVLYIPSFWMHYIVSLRYSIQCNRRSGLPEGKQGLSDIEECMDISFG